MSDAGADVLDALDDVLLRLMGAIDITARLARLALGLDEDLARLGWTSRRKFLRAVRGVHPPLAALFDAGSAHRLTLDVISTLRNTIHHTALPEIQIGEWRGSQQTWVGLRAAEEPLVLAAADSLGGRERWGVSEPTRGQFRLDAGRLTDQLVIHTAALVVAVQDATPVEQLESVIPGLSVDLTPELDEFGFDTAARVRLQLGLGTDAD